MLRFRTTSDALPRPASPKAKARKVIHGFKKVLVEKFGEAMTSTKRKFNTLLSGLGNKSSMALSAAKEENGRLSTYSTVDLTNDPKRRRLSSENLIPRSPRTNFTSTLATQTTMHSKSMSLAAAEHHVDEAPPTYAPWDREAFLRRLRTYCELRYWYEKPNAVNEVEWAKRGWINIGEERVRCVSCNIALLLKINEKMVDGKRVPVLHAPDIEQALVDRYAEMIITSHADNCLWRQRGCDDTIFKMPLYNAVDSLTALRKRYDELVSIKDLLPYMHNMRFPQGFDLTTILTYLPKDFFASTSIEGESSREPEINKVAIGMALFGWQLRVATVQVFGSTLAQCQNCFRTLGFWLFRSREVNEAGEPVKMAVMNCLEPDLQHRRYCPWANAVAQSGRGLSDKTHPEETLLNGWQTLVRVLKNDHYLRTAAEHPPEHMMSGAAAQNVFNGDLEDEKVLNAREEADKTRFARLRKVKSMLETKVANKLHKDRRAN